MSMVALSSSQLRSLWLYYCKEGTTVIDFERFHELVNDLYKSDDSRLCTINFAFSKYLLESVFHCDKLTFPIFAMRFPVLFEQKLEIYKKWKQTNIESFGNSIKPVLSENLPEIQPTVKAATLADLATQLNMAETKNKEIPILQEKLQSFEFLSSQLSKENEELKSSLATTADLNENLKSEITQIKQENQRLKDELSGVTIENSALLCLARQRTNTEELRRTLMDSVGPKFDSEILEILAKSVEEAKLLLDLQEKKPPLQAWEGIARAWESISTRICEVLAVVHKKN
jgi:hypothetical protein